MNLKLHIVLLSELCNPQDLFSNSPYCLLYDSYDVHLENLVLDEMTIPELLLQWFLKRNSAAVLHGNQSVDKVALHWVTELLI